MQRLELAHMKKTIAVMIIAALILAAIPALMLPNAKADASEARVLTNSFYVAPSSGFMASKAGDLVVVGEIQNVGSGFLQNVSLTATALNSNGTTLGTAQGIAFVYQTPPGQKAPFAIDFSPANTWSSNVASVSVSVLAVTDAVTPPYSGLKFVETPANITGSPYMVVGTIVNKGSQTMQHVWVVTTFYDSVGTVIGLNFTNYLPSEAATVRPNDPIHYVATPADNTVALSNAIASYSIVIDSIPLGSSSSSGGPTATPTGSAGSSPAFPTLPIIVLVVVAVVAVVALLFLRKRPETQPPPPPPPPPEASPEGTPESPSENPDQ